MTSSLNLLPRAQSHWVPPPWRGRACAGLCAWLLWSVSLAICITSGAITSGAMAEEPEELAVAQGAGALGLRFVCGQALGATEGSELLKRAQAAYQSVATLRASFLQESSVAALDETEEASGSVTFQRPGRMRWDYHFPERQVFLVRDQTVWFYQPDLTQVIVHSLGDVLLEDMPVSFLMGIGDLSKDFILGESCRTSTGVLFTLDPRRERGSVEEGLQSFELLVSKEDSLPRGARVRDLGGNVTTIILSGLTVDDVGLAVDTFEPEFPAGVDIDDRRDGVAAVP